MLKSIGFQIQTLIIVLWFILVTVVIASSVIICSFFSRTGNGPHLLARFWANSILWVSRATITVSGTEKLDPNRSYIYMANHQSNFDIPVCFWGVPPGSVPLAGQGGAVQDPRFSATGHARRGVHQHRPLQPQKSLREPGEAARSIRNGTVSVMIFPEGTRSLDGQILPFKKGGFVLCRGCRGAHRTDYHPTGTRDIMPKGQPGGSARPGESCRYLDPPIETTDYTRKTKDQR
jgi:1-acyl-sn-glycerol-3-phosphate acyltransferase